MSCLWSLACVVTNNINTSDFSTPPGTNSHLLTHARAFSTPRGRKCPGVNNWSSFIDTFLHFAPFCRARKVSIYCEACLRVHVALFTYMGTSSPFVLAAASVSCASCRHPALPLSLRRTCLVVPAQTSHFSFPTFLGGTTTTTSTESVCRRLS